MDQTNSANRKNDVSRDPGSSEWWKSFSSALVERGEADPADWPEELTNLRTRLEEAARRAGTYLTSHAVETLESRCEAIESRLDRIERRLEGLETSSDSA